MAGLGRKLFTRGILSSADVQGYLMDQAVMQFASASARAAAISSPDTGMVTYLEDVDRLEYRSSTGAWRPLPRGVTGAYYSGNTSAGGDVLVSHGLPAAPTIVQLTMAGVNNPAIYAKSVVGSVTATVISVRTFDTRTGAVWPSVPVEFYWQATLL